MMSERTFNGSPESAQTDLPAKDAEVFGWDDLGAEVYAARDEEFYSKLGESALNPFAQYLAPVSDRDRLQGVDGEADAAENEKNLPIGEKFYLVREKLDERTERAINDTTEFTKTPEVRESIRDYYEDHEKVQIAVDALLSGEVVTDELLSGDDGIKAGGLRDSIVRLRDAVDGKDTLATYQALRTLTEGAWNECCVGALTAGEDEESKMVTMSETAEKWRLDNYYGLPANQLSLKIDHEAAQKKLNDNKEIFWKDARQAGQLLYHNTPNYTDILKSGMQLGTRSYQQQEYGDYRAATMDSDGHSQSIHWTEEFDTEAYKQSLASGRQGEGLELGATVAVPIAEIIESTPYARGGTYGMLEVVQPEEIDKKVDLKTNIRAATSEVYWHNAGESDNMPSERGLDRTFYSDAEDKEKGSDYAYDIGVGMASDQGNSSHVIYLQRDIDKVDRQSILSREHAGRFAASETLANLGAGYGMPNVHVMNYDYGAGGAMGVTERDMREGLSFVNDQGMDALNQYYGAVADLRMSDPRLLRTANEEYSYQNLSKNEQHDNLQRSIDELQKASAKDSRYAGKVVVRLRGSSMTYSSKG